MRTERSSGYHFLQKAHSAIQESQNSTERAGVVADVGGGVAGGAGPLDDRQLRVVVETVDTLMAIGLEPNSAAPRDRRPAPVAAGQLGPEERHGGGVKRQAHDVGPAHVVDRDVAGFGREVR